MVKKCFYLMLVFTLTTNFYGCRKNDLKYDIDWIDGLFDCSKDANIALKSDTSQYFCKNGPFYPNNPYVSSNIPIKNFYEVFDLPATTLGGEKVSSCIVATTTCDYNEKRPNDILSNSKIYSGSNHTYNGGYQTQYPRDLHGNPLMRNSFLVNYAINRPETWQHLTIEIWSGPYRRGYDMAEGNLYWTASYSKKDLPFVNMDNRSVSVGEFKING
ncbi:MAG: hypothetical protein LBC68_09375, partial [Prevotellaceae bacterium]|nr:hypothetical protein [Prevotellaceae bacterium]